MLLKEGKTTRLNAAAKIFKGWASCHTQRQITQASSGRQQTEIVHSIRGLGQQRNRCGNRDRILDWRRRARLEIQTLSLALCKEALSTIFFP